MANFRHAGVPAPQPTTLYWVQRENQLLREQVMELVEERAVLYHRIELLQAYAKSLLRGEQSSWWAWRAATAPPAPEEIQEAMQSQFSEQKLAIEQQILRDKLKRDHLDAEMHKMEVAEMDTGTLEPKRRGN